MVVDRSMVALRLSDFRRSQTSFKNVIVLNLRGHWIQSILLMPASLQLKC